ncbi:MAG: 50S ribosomal protein L9 [Betaproteobacteria bacterium]|jgi:large subunit ribosomal protein L9|nr:50S ribosomal protein L9 [Burkholderiales bacterium]MBT6410988.1 50S ribosomal protein L9 [Betaproteobacteria bacterium]MCH1423793.1 50S ribosomal protein L9 [Burkholderiales bacterium]HAT52566.1 50S ribosomal protein L9 [Betaproteobacteria bacterium]HAU82594.1 50S ribosomal protein L9 [Betaproteobacteria bacterium]
MEIILLEQVVNLGRLGDLVNVKEGYARNYLIPQGKAQRATKENLAEFEQKRAELEAQQAKILSDAQTKFEKIDGASIEIMQKAGVDGRLFGSVTHYDIADALNVQGYEINKNQIQMPTGPLKQIGEASISVSLHAEVVATITVTVTPEQ